MKSSELWQASPGLRAILRIRSRPAIGEWNDSSRYAYSYLGTDRPRKPFTKSKEGNPGGPQIRAACPFCDQPVGNCMAGGEQENRHRCERRFLCQKMRFLCAGFAHH